MLRILGGMDIILYALLAAAVCLLLLLIAAWFVLQKTRKETRRLAERVNSLPLRKKLGLAVALMRDARMPVGLRALPPLLIFYLALPLDLIPDFIPVIGQLDDVAALLVGGALLLKFAPMNVLEEHIASLEAAPAVHHAA